jgi:cytochrome P450
MFSRYEDVRAASVNTATCSSADGTTVPRHAVRTPPEDTDPPEHRKYRDILNPPFAPGAIAAAEPWMRDIAITLFDTVAGEHSFDFVLRWRRLCHVRSSCACSAPVVKTSHDERTEAPRVLWRL